MTPEEPLRFERAAETKSEHDDGVVYAVAGASLEYNLIVAGLIRSLGDRLPPGCRVLPSDMKVRIPNPTRVYYPDVSGVCERPHFADDETDVLLNPLIVFEVLPDSTVTYTKFRSYQTIDSLQELVFVLQDLYLVEHYRRDGEHWIYTVVQGRDAHVTLPAVHCELPLADIYYQVEPAA